MRIAICDDEEKKYIAWAKKLRSVFPALELSVYSSGVALFATLPPARLLRYGFQSEVSCP